MNTDTVVTFTDFSAAADNAVTRAAQLAARLGVPLQLGYSGESSGPELGDRLVRLGMRSRQLARRWAIDVQHPPGETRDLGHWLAARRLSALVVVDPATAASLKLRSPWGRGAALIDHGTSPVLLVHRDAGQPCDTVLIACVQHDDALRLGRLAARVTDARTLELFDLDAGRRAARATAADEGPERLREWPPPMAPEGGFPQIRYSDLQSSRRNRVLFHGRPTDKALSVLYQAQHADADLVVAMCPPSSVLERWLRRTFQQRLARALGCDLLLCPMDHAHPSAADARRRLLPISDPSPKGHMLSSWRWA